MNYIQIYPVNNATHDGDQIIGVNVNQTHMGYFTIKQITLFLKLLCQKNIIKIVAFHIHHIMGFLLPVIKFLATELQTLTSRWYIHDFYTICPQTNLLYNGISYCGVPMDTAAICKMCNYGAARNERQSEMGKLLRWYKGTFVFPSESARDIWLKVYPELKKQTRVVPHQIVFQKCSILQSKFDKENSVIRVAYVGAQALHKGWHVWKDFVEETQQYEYFHLGSINTQLSNVQYIPVSLADGENAMIKALAENDIDIAFLWSICPETYSFTLFESLAAGCFIVTNADSGNIAAQVASTGQGKVFTTIQEMMDFFKHPNDVFNAVAKCKATWASIGLENNLELLDETMQVSLTEN
jgi:hypothetical protein